MLDVDFSGADDFGEIQRRFISVSRCIFEQYDLELRGLGKRLKISSLELYLYAPNWPDRTTHCDRAQLSSLRWYLHSHGARRSTMMGLDITVGNEEKNIYGGLLIRGIEDIDGSGRAVNSIVTGTTGRTKRDWKYSSECRKYLKEAVDGVSVFSGDVALVPCSPNARKELYVGPRVGLSRLATKVDEKFINCDLRVATWMADSKLRKWMGVSDA